jgi:hypothetical protein
VALPRHELKASAASGCAHVPEGGENVLCVEGYVLHALALSLSNNYGTHQPDVHGISVISRILQ